ncbi:BMP family ABC transporter substrate-binding protein [Nocardioides cavernaquae]|uniref:BMP family ABC transporter substrate-binding protein n=1 Tax=Nocardioides cavernaquae TaxID=2321396 RepID=A0A3A5HC89_9ACTN|nr:BMP family ABC transporter substrate-binding protein [Nocardioides cavernaquae]RJS47498.1 BMP family ABC transporter substrate-binding protein [Nocardioides cavernaquae]
MRIPSGRLLAGLVLTSLATSSLTACGGSSSAGGKDLLKVGVFLPGSTSDTGFMQSAHLGYERAKKAHADTAKLSMAEEVDPADYEEVLTSFASTNDLVVSVGGQTDADLRRVAAQFPDVTFVEIGGPSDAEPLANLAYYDPQQAEAEYLTGAAAALASTKHSVGFIGGMELPAIVNAAEAFGNGAVAAVPGTKVLKPQFVGDFNDPAKAKQAADADIAAGADVLGQIVNLGKAGIEQAVRSADARMIGGPIPGECSADSPYAAYIRTDIGAEVEYAIEAVLDGTWKAVQEPFGLTSDHDATELTFCGDDAEAKTTLEKLAAQLADASVTAY